MPTVHVNITLRIASQLLAINLGAIVSCRVCRYSFKPSMDTSQWLTDYWNKNHTDKLNL